MTSRYYFVNFRDLKLRNPERVTKNLWCDICKNNDHQFCNCQYFSGNTNLPDKLNASMRIVGGIGVKRDSYYDEIIRKLLSEEV